MRTSLFLLDSLQVLGNTNHITDTRGIGWPVKSGERRNFEWKVKLLAFARMTVLKADSWVKCADEHMMHITKTWDRERGNGLEGSYQPPGSQKNGGQ